VPTFGVFHRRISATGGDDFKRPSKREEWLCDFEYYAILLASSLAKLAEEVEQ